MATIKITCETCHKTHEVTKTNEIPEHVVSMGCNWCPECEDRAEDYYEEWYNDNDGDNGNGGDDVPDNQLVMPFIIQEINENVEADMERSICV
jgi:hypothetical protein